MLRTYLYIPDDLEKKITLKARNEKKSKAEVMRDALEKGIEITQESSAKSLLKLAEIGANANFKGTHDSSRMDELLWGKDWDKDE